MPLVVGIDEAGYGPLLGPLVVGATAWQVPAEVVDQDLWPPLAECVARLPRRGDWRLSIGDSKQVFARGQGLGGLERTILALAQACELPTTTAGELLAALNIARGGRDGLPWYRDPGRRLPIDSKRAASPELVAKLRRVMLNAGVVCRAMLAAVLTEDDYNRAVQQTDNKAAVLLSLVLRLIGRSAVLARDDELIVTVDRLGGRAHYREVLMQAFPDRTLSVTDESPGHSAYVLTDSQTCWRCTFAVKADQRHLPVAAASMLAKYLRELLMLEFNDYWRRQASDLRPTAGYYTDAQRFLADIAPLMARSELDPQTFIRCR